MQKGTHRKKWSLQAKALLTVSLIIFAEYLVGGIVVPTGIIPFK